MPTHFAFGATTVFMLFFSASLLCAQSATWQQGTVVAVGKGSYQGKPYFEVIVDVPEKRYVVRPLETNFWVRVMGGPVYASSVYFQAGQAVDIAVFSNSTARVKGAGGKDFYAEVTSQILRLSATDGAKVSDPSPENRPARQPRATPERFDSGGIDRPTLQRDVGAMPSATAAPPPEPQWVYKTVNSDAELNALTASGWRLVTMTSDAQGQHYLMKITKDLVAPRLLQKVEPNYTEQAYMKHIEGDVTLSCVVTSEGRPTNIKVTRSLDPGLDASAIAAVKQWVFQPATNEGNRISAAASVVTTFTINPGHQPRAWFVYDYASDQGRKR